LHKNIAYKYPAKKGFTLIELMLVSVIILVLAALSTPLFRKTYEDLRFTAYAKDMFYTIYFCRERSIFERKTYAMVIDDEKNTYNVFFQNQDSGEFEILRDRGRSVLQIPEGVDIKTDVVKIFFSPNGYMDSAIITISDKKNRIQQILLDGKAGSVIMSDYAE
jgi:prepilin-type N-terminal cleavage/methylation domain-containing protein